MPDKFRNRYRIGSNRLPGWDYNRNGLYFITLVTQHRNCILGRIIQRIGENNSTKNETTNGDWNAIVHMEPSDFGKIVCNEWMKSFEIRRELYLHEWIMMPNHIHAIIGLENGRTETTGGDNRDTMTGGGMNDGTDGGTMTHVETHGRASLQFPSQQSASQQSASQQSPSQQFPYQQFSSEPSADQPHRLAQSISSFIAGFKSAVNSKIDDYIDMHHLNVPKYNRNNHFFQPNYHDHIIRNYDEYVRIKNYIANNPLNWENDSLK